MNKIFDWIYEHFGLPGLIVFMVLLMFAVLSIQPVDGSKTDPSMVADQIKTQYTDVVMGEAQVLWAFSLKGCSRDDSAVFPFTAVNANGNPVSGRACVRAFTHKVSFRIDRSP